MDCNGPHCPTFCPLRSATSGLSVISNEWYGLMVDQLTGENPLKPTEEDLRVTDTNLRDLTDVEVVLLITTAISQNAIRIPFIVMDGVIGSMQDLMSCILNTDCLTRVTHQGWKQIRICRVQSHWAVVLLIWGRDSFFVHVYHPGMHCSSVLHKPQTGGPPIYMHVHGVGYQTDMEEDECVPFTVWCVVYIQMFMQMHSEAPGHIPWFSKKNEAAEMKYVCKQFLQGKGLRR